MRTGRFHRVRRAFDEDRSRGAQAILPARTLRRFHTNDRGNMAMLLLLTIIVLWAMSGLIWNTGAMVSARISTQTAADTTAYTAATWNARTVNLVTGSNAQLVRITSAEAVAWAMPVTALWVILNWVIELVIAIAALIELNPQPLIEWIAAVPPKEIPAMIPFFQVAFPLFVEYPNHRLLDKADEIAAMQEAAIKATPAFISQDVEWLNEKYLPSFTLNVYQPYRHGDWGFHDDSSLPTTIVPPLKEGGYGSIFIPSLIQLLKDVDGWWDEALKEAGGGNGGKYGRAKAWYAFSILSLAIVHAVRDNNYELVNTTGASFYQPVPEFGSVGSPDEGDKYFSVIATAQLDDPSAGNRMTMDRLFHRRMFPFHGLPNDEEKVVAYAQAEVFNPVGQMIEGFGIIHDILAIFPWQTSSTWGWQWQVRLAPATTFDELVRIGGQDGLGGLGPFTDPTNSAATSAINLH